VAACVGTNDPAGECQDPRRIAQHRAPDTALAGDHMEFANMFLSRVIHQPIKLQSAVGRSGHLVAVTTIGLALGMLVVPLDAAPRRLVRVPRPPPVALGARSSVIPAVASQNRDQKRPSQADDAARDDEACLQRLRAASVGFDIPTMPVAAKAACTIEVPVRLKSVAARARGVTEVHLPEEPVVSCVLAERLAAWLGNLVAPLIAGRISTDLWAVRTGPGYECRNRNGAATGKLSAHAEGKAIDITAFELSSGKLIPIKPDGDQTVRNVVDTVRTAACGWFTTVLGPGADAAHTDHLHVDVAPHGTSDRYRICQ
jgi:hypothetical protein